MPTYEYKCDACGFEFEKFQSIKASPVRKCPKCGKRKVKRLISSGAGLIFKGSGFYITDYRNEAYKSAAKADSGAESKDTGSKETAPKDSPAGKETKSSDAPASKPAAEAKPAAAAKEAPKSKPTAPAKGGKSEK